MLNFSKCNFTASYYCTHCFGPEMWPIPMKILFDWDFNQYPVSKSSARFLGEIQYHPLFNMRTIHRKLYKSNKEMIESKVRTVKLSSLKRFSYSFWFLEFKKKGKCLQIINYRSYSILIIVLAYLLILLKLVMKITHTKI